MSFEESNNPRSCQIVNNQILLTELSMYEEQAPGVVWITCGLLWCFYQLFELPFWRHPFTAEDPLASIRKEGEYILIFG